MLFVVLYVTEIEVIYKCETIYSSSISLTLFINGSLYLLQIMTNTCRAKNYELQYVNKISILQLKLNSKLINEAREYTTNINR